VSHRCLIGVSSVSQFQDQRPCKAKPPKVGEAWSGRTSPSGSAPWESPPGRLGGFLLRLHAPAGEATDRPGCASDVRPSVGLGRQRGRWVWHEGPLPRRDRGVAPANSPPWRSARVRRAPEWQRGWVTRLGPQPAKELRPRPPTLRQGTTCAREFFLDRLRHKVHHGRLRGHAVQLQRSVQRLRNPRRKLHPHHRFASRHTAPFALTPQAVPQED